MCHTQRWSNRATNISLTNCLGTNALAYFFVKKRFLTLTPWANVIKLLTDEIYERT
jgi:hypothetical protein